MKGFSKINVKTAVSNRSFVDLSRSYLATLNFGEIVPSFVEELVPGDKISHLKSNVFSRCAPMVVPTYGEAYLKQLAVFVPYYQIAKDADSWLSGQQIFNGVTARHRFITMGELFVFLNSISENSTESNFDYKFHNGTDFQYRKFTNKGRYAYKVLRSLGYQIPIDIDLRPNSVWLLETSKIKLSAYPILAFFKAYNDWMNQAQKFNQSQLSYILYNIKLGINFELFGNNVFLNGEIFGNSLSLMFGDIYLMYQNDFFTSAWRYPNSPVNDPTVQENINRISFVDDINSSKSINRNHFNDEFGISLDKVTARQLDFLQRFDAWVRRQNFAGSRDVHQIYARFGIKTDDFQSHFAHVVGTSSMPLNVGDVTATAQTDGTSFETALGAYAGKGIISGSEDYSYSSSDYGCFIVLSWITVKPVYADGFNKMVLRASPFDYFNPEFDALGAQPISCLEVCSDNKHDDQTISHKADAVYGFTERYNEYRFGRDVIVGDFSLYDDMKAWHFGRNLSAVQNRGQLYAQSNSMVRVSPFDSEYNRIFSDFGPETDKFYVTMRFDCKALRPMKALNETANLGEGNTQIDRNGNIIN